MSRCFFFSFLILFLLLVNRIRCIVTEHKSCTSDDLTSGGRMDTNERPHLFTCSFEGNVLLICQKPLLFFYWNWIIVIYIYKLTRLKREKRHRWCDDDDDGDDGFGLVTWLIFFHFECIIHSNAYTAREWVDPSYDIHSHRDGDSWCPSLKFYVCYCRCGICHSKHTSQKFYRNCF